ncbi:Hypothetical predicted protein [Mytilus galloprovincialis]|uniref:PHD-type domain-containing protein n=1 Tax=Mytilus galloprovincialis TaxID=29158 RepID=A0A8B6HEB5_MYTGA|nr:Hypothetical predicted protein [Mytilus galloprovincialis]
MMRRSERNKKKKEVFSPKEIKSKAIINLNNKCTPVYTPDTSFDDEEETVVLKPYEICIGCGEGKIKKQTDWIECDSCRNWWHCCCANISQRDTQKFNKYNIKFSCAFCIIRKIEISKRAKKIVNTCTCKEEVEVNDEDYKEINTKLQCKADVPVNGKISTKKEISCIVNDPELVLVADNIENKELRNSKLIRKEITKSEDLRDKVKLAYRLPLGGVAVHFYSKQQKVDFQNKTVIEDFGKDSCWHNPKSCENNKETIGFGKNVPLNTNLENLKDKIERQTNTNIISISQQRYWDTKKLMPVVKINFYTHQKT